MRRLLAIASALAMTAPVLADQPSVQVLPPDLHGSRPLEAQTGPAVVRDYLESWQQLRAAFDQNQPDLLNTDFVGTAREELGSTIVQQAKLGIHTHYQDESHNLQIVFYSPQGMSIQLLDNVEYDEQVVENGKVLATQHLKARYVVVLTPTETRWKVRIFQAAADQPSS